MVRRAIRRPAQLPEPIDTTRDAPRDRLAPAGTPFDRPSVAARERGFVISCDAARDVYRVQTNSGRVIVVPRIRSSVGDNDRIPNGTPVRVDFSLGAPYIDGILPPETRQTAFDSPANVTDTTGHGGQDPLLNRNMLVGGRAAGEPNDILPGDFVRTSPDNAAIGALHGKVAILRGSPLAQIRAHGENDNLEIISGTYRHITWMGESKVVNDQGKTSFVWRGGSDQLTQTGADEERYTLRLDVGHTGDVANFRVTTPEGNDLFRFHVDPQGRLAIFARGGIDMAGGGRGQHPHRIQGDHLTEIDGTRVLRTTGTVTHDFQLNHELTVGENLTIVCGRDYSTRINSNYDISIGGTSRTTSVGNMQTLVSEGVFSVQTQLRDISFNLQRGNYTVFAVEGNMDLSFLHGRVIVHTELPDSIKLGEGARSHGTKFEELIQELQRLITDFNNFKLQVAAHIHPVPGPATGLSPTLPPFAAAFTPNFTPARSTHVQLR